MAPTIALLIWAVLLLGLLCFDPARKPGTSVALWVPLTWFVIIASRLPSQWFGYGLAASESQALEDGNPLDRGVFLALIVVAIIVLVSRSFSWGRFLANNGWLVAFLLFALMSACWSDFPFIAFKRWFRDLANYLMVLVILSDRDPLEAVRWVLRRLCYLLVPLSIVLVKYYPWIGKQFDTWSGQGYFVGVTTSKNMLGALCLISGIFFFWDIITRWPERKETRARRIILLDFALALMTLWLLHLASSATSDVCLALSCCAIWLTRTQLFKRHSSALKVLIPLSFPIYLILAFVVGLNGDLVEALGRNPTLTNRTLIWNLLLSMHTNPLLGVGYDSFWLGSRLQVVWRYFPGINEAHNGYLDIYLDLGIIGVALLLLFLFASYRNVWKMFAKNPALGSISLGAWVVLMFYNVTEAAFKGGLIWLVVLLGGLSVPAVDPHLAEAPFPKRWPDRRPPLPQPDPQSSAIRPRSATGAPVFQRRSLGRRSDF